jgi:N-acetylneuraminic acid mutarotase
MLRFSRRIFRLVFVALLLAAGLTAHGASAQDSAQTNAQTNAPASAHDNSWTELPPMPEAVVDAQAASVNGKLYVFGGLDGARSKGAVFEFDAASASWTKRKPMPVAAHHMAIASYGDRLYLFGGFRTPEKSGGWQPIDNAWEYDPASDAWKALKPLPARRGGAAAAARDGKFYVIGGAAPAADTEGAKDTIDAKRRHDILAQVDEYDFKTDTWRSRAPLPTPRAQAVAATITGKIYVVGGRLGSLLSNGSDTDIVESYDAAADRWSAPLERMPTARAATGFGVWRNLIVIAGSDLKDAKQAASAIEAYDPVANKWRTLPALPGPRRGAAIAVIGDRLYVAGGETAAPSAGQKPETGAVSALSLDAVKAQP